MALNPEKLSLMTGESTPEMEVDFSKRGGRRAQWSFKAMAFHALVALLYLGSFGAVQLWQTRSQQVAQATAGGKWESPAAATLEVPLHEQAFTTLEKTPYNGQPSETTLAAWHDLLSNVNLRVAPDVLARSNQSSVPLAEGSQLAWHDVHHQLHCLKYLHLWVWRDYVVITDDHAEALLPHLDHCVELLRQAVMCQPDETYMTFEWRDGKPKPSMKIEGPPRMCVDWETWERKFASQIVPGEEMATLVNPNL